MLLRLHRARVLLAGHHSTMAYRHGNSDWHQDSHQDFSYSEPPWRGGSGRHEPRSKPKARAKTGPKPVAKAKRPARATSPTPPQAASGSARPAVRRSQLPKIQDLIDGIHPASYEVASASTWWRSFGPPPQQGLDSGAGDGSTFLDKTARLYRQHLQQQLRDAAKVLQARWETGHKCEREREDIGILKFMLLSMKPLSSQIVDLTNKVAEAQVELARLKQQSNDHEAKIRDKEENIHVMQLTLRRLHARLAQHATETGNDDLDYDEDYADDIRSTLRSASSSGPSWPRAAAERRPLSPLRRQRARSHSPPSPTGVWQPPTPRAKSQSPQPKKRPTDPKVKRKLEGQIAELQSMLVSKDIRNSELAKQLEDVKRRAITDAASRSKTTAADRETFRKECIQEAHAEFAASKELDRQVIDDLKQRHSRLAADHASSTSRQRLLKDELLAAREEATSSLHLRSEHRAHTAAWQEELQAQAMQRSALAGEAATESAACQRLSAELRTAHAASHSDAARRKEEVDSEVRQRLASAESEVAAQQRVVQLKLQQLQGTEQLQYDQLIRSEALMNESAERWRQGEHGTSALEEECARLQRQVTALHGVNFHHLRKHQESQDRIASVYSEAKARESALRTELEVSSSEAARQLSAAEAELESRTTALRSAAAHAHQQLHTEHQAVVQKLRLTESADRSEYIEHEQVRYTELLGHYTTTRAELEAHRSSLASTEAQLEKRKEAMDTLQYQQSEYTKEVMDLQQAMDRSATRHRELAAQTEQQQQRRAAELQEAAMQLAAREEATRIAQEKLRADQQAFHQEVWSRTAAAGQTDRAPAAPVSPLQDCQPAAPAPPAPGAQQPLPLPWPTPPGQPAERTSPAFGMEDALAAVIPDLQDLQYWTCPACCRIYDATIRTCSCNPHNPTQAGKCEWMNTAAATLYLKEMGETAVQSLKWAHEPKLELQPAEVFSYGNLPPSAAALASLPPIAQRAALRRRVRQQAAKLKPLVADEAIEHLLGQPLHSVVDMLTHKDILAEKLAQSIRATVPPFPVGKPTQLSPRAATTQPSPTAQPAAPASPPPELSMMVPASAEQPVPRSPGPEVHSLPEGDTPRQPSASAPTTPAGRDPPPFRGPAVDRRSPTITEPDDKRQKLGSALVPFKAVHKAEQPGPQPPAGNGPEGGP